MNWVDLLVVALALAIALIGARQGLVVTVPAIVLLLVGVVTGIKVAPSVVAGVDDSALRAGLSVGIPVLLAAFGEMLGVFLGRKAKAKISNRHLTGVDNALGAALQAAVVLVVAWFVLLSLTGMPGMPGLVSAINSSRVLGGVNSLMPQAVKALPGQLRDQLQFPSFPAISDPFTSTPIGRVGAPDTALQRSAIVNQVHESVVKVDGVAPSCSRRLEGTGFVVAPRRVMTNAHVVAGTGSVDVQTTTGEQDAKVTYYDPQTDVAILDVPDLSAPVLDFDRDPVKRGQDSIVLGYPLDGPYTASAARVRDEIPLRGPDIYGTSTVRRDVYTIRAQVRSGNSGGPLITPDGEVLGVIFGAAVDDSETGFALTPEQVSGAMESVGSTQEVSTGNCAE